MKVIHSYDSFFAHILEKLNRMPLTDYKGNAIEYTEEYDKIKKELSELTIQDPNTGVQKIIFNEGAADILVDLAKGHKEFEAMKGEDYYEQEGEKIAREVFGHDEG